jgi:hypothetical protein
MVEAARLRAAAVANVIQMKPKAAIEALPVQHDAAELKPNSTSAANGFRRRF